jgi:hypothetical protein
VTGSHRDAGLPRCKVNPLEVTFHCCGDVTDEYYQESWRKNGWLSGYFQFKSYSKAMALPMTRIAVRIACVISQWPNQIWVNFGSSAWFQNEAWMTAINAGLGESVGHVMWGYRMHNHSTGMFIICQSVTQYWRKQVRDRLYACATTIL